jgi:glycosyltransferase involved in cell wall biosynthesis
MKPLILFITRNYPPKVGGLESYSYHLIRQFEKTCTVFKITLSRSRWHLFWFLPFCLLRAVWLCRRHSIRCIHLCDGLLATIGLALKYLVGARVTASVHGLDVTYPRAIYQMIVPRCLSRLDLVFCGSRHGLEQCLQRRIPAHQCRVVPYGIDPAEFELPAPDPSALADIEAQAGVDLKGRKILLTVGRLVPRKGVAWFVSHVMPKLDEGYGYLIAGAGPDFQAVKNLIRDHGLTDRVALLGRVPDAARRRLMALADLFIMPNIRIPGDMEGFGIAALEAGSSGLPVIASNIEGLRDAVIEGITGHLIEERNVQQYVEKIHTARFNRDKVRSVVNQRFNWSHIASRYHAFLFERPAIPPTAGPPGVRRGYEASSWDIQR